MRIKKFDNSIIIVLFFLLIALISCRINSTRNNNFTKIKISPDTIFIDKVKIGDSAEVRFSIKNIGDKKLKINKIAPACECSIVNFDTSLLDVNKETFVNIVYKNKADTGRINKIFIIDANTHEGLIPVYMITKK